MKKKIFAVLLALCALFLFAGCGEEVPEPVFRISAETMQLKEGEQKNLTLEIVNLGFFEGEELVWSTSSPQVAQISVDETARNKVTVLAKAAGSAVITAVAGEYIQACAVTVSKGPFIHLTRDTLSLLAGRTAMIEIGETNVSETLSFSSDDPAVATVNSEGLVTAVAGGTAHITVSGGGASVQCTVNVTAPFVSLDQSVVLLTLEEGSDSIQLTATSNGPVRWSSSLPSVADVEDGLVTAHAVGETVITARYESASASCTVKVKEQHVVLTLSEQEKSIEEGESFQLTASLTPASPDAEILWEVVEGQEIVSVDTEGRVTSLGGYGEATVRASLASDGDVFADCKVTVLEPYSDWIKISDAETLRRALAAGNENKKMYLTQDIDLGGELFTATLGSFSGIFDGRGYTLSYHGGKLFGSLAQEGIVRNFGVNLVADSLGGNEGIFGLELLGTVENCRIEVEFGTVQWQAAFARNSKGTVLNTLILVRNPKGTQNVYAGTTQGGGTWEGCYYAAEGAVGGNGPACKTEEELKSSDLYAEWDRAVWELSEGELPALIHE